MNTYVLDHASKLRCDHCDAALKINVLTGTDRVSGSLVHQDDCPRRSPAEAWIF